MDKWPGGQNGGNHWHRTEYRKKNGKKWKQPERPLDNIKYTNIHIIGVPEGEETREKSWENIWRDDSWKLP